MNPLLEEGFNLTRRLHDLCILDMDDSPEASWIRDKYDVLCKQLSEEECKQINDLAAQLWKEFDERL